MNLILAELGELGLIERLRLQHQHVNDSILVGWGDDCAAIQTNQKQTLLLTTDMLVEGVHFLLKGQSAQELGAKAMAVNISDIAGMGGQPLYALVSIALPPKISVSFIDDLYQGMNELARKFGAGIIGGDTVRSEDKIVINIALVGEASEGRMLRRNQAKPGDKIFVTGTLGDSAAGLNAILHDHVEHVDAQEVVVRHRVVHPQVREGQFMARSPFAHAMMDISDGLTMDLMRLCQQSQVGCNLHADQIPISNGLRKYTTTFALDPLPLALTGGEDYVLLVVGTEQLLEVAQAEGILMFDVGEITADSANHIVTTKGGSMPWPKTPWQHFSLGNVLI